MKTASLIVLLVCLQGCVPDYAALKERRDDGSIVQFHEHRHDIEERLGQSVGIVPRSDGGFMELYLAPACGSECTGVSAGLSSDCRWRRVFVQYDEADRVLSVLVERRQNHAGSLAAPGHCQLLVRRVDIAAT